jgi:hypothetical protein
VTPLLALAAVWAVALAAPAAPADGTCAASPAVAAAAAGGGAFAGVLVGGFVMPVALRVLTDSEVPTGPIVLAAGAGAFALGVIGATLGARLTTPDDAHAAALSAAIVIGGLVAVSTALGWAAFVERKPTHIEPRDPLVLADNLALLGAGVLGGAAAAISAARSSCE